MMNQKYSANSDIKFKRTMLWSNSCDYVDACILVKGTIITIGVGANDAEKQLHERNKGVMFKNYINKKYKNSKI